MEILTFDICGKFAHFRRFYSNSTALSYTIPPRTTIMGIIAACIGKEKNSYYQEFSSSNLLLGIAVKSKMKKSFHRLNMLKVLSPSDFRGAKGRTQIPLEVISGEDLRTDDLTYRIFISSTETGDSTFELIKERLTNSNSWFNISLGLANFSASICNVKLYNKATVSKVDAINEIVELHSAGNTEDINRLQIETDQYNSIEEDLFPADFKANGDREVIAMNRLIFTINNIPLKVQLTGTYYKLEIDDEIQNIQFLKATS